MNKRIKVNCENETRDFKICLIDKSEALVIQLVFLKNYFEVKLKSKTIYKFAEMDTINHFINARLF